MSEKAFQTNHALPVPVDAMRSLLTERKHLIVKIGKDTYEITRPLALELWRMCRDYASMQGFTFHEDCQVLYASPEQVIVKVILRIAREGQVILELTEIGEATAREGKNDTMARTAFTRAMKRLFEKLAGEDFINKVIKTLFKDSIQEAPASEKQKELIRKLLQEGKITKETIVELIAEGKLPEGFILKEALKQGLTYSQAKEIIGKALSK